MSPKLRVGISACLLGDEVRWDGGHERHRYLVEVLGRHVEWVRVCPEVEMGLGVPREAIALVRTGEEHRLLGTETRRDLMEAMRSFGADRARTLSSWGLSGFVLKHRSPSCGLGGARVYESLEELHRDGPYTRSGRGLFAEALARRHPWLPLAREIDLDEIEGRHHFVERIFAYRRLRDLLGGSWTRSDLKTFHDRHELQIVAHSAEGRKRLARIVEAPASSDPSVVAARYSESFTEALARPVTRERQLGTLRRAWNRVQGRLSSELHLELDDAIRDYGEGRVDLGVPQAFLREAARGIDDRILVGQTWLEPDPRELAIRAEP